MAGGRGSVSDHVELLGVRIDCRPDGAAVVDELLSWHDGGSPRRMYYANAHVINLAQHDVRLKRALDEADLVICEGWGVRLGARVAGVSPPVVVQTMDWVDDHLAGLAQGGLSVFLLGDEPGVADACGEEMVRRHRGLQIVGSRHGFFERGGSDEARLVADIRASGADVIYVGMGSPRQEAWLEYHLDELDVPVALALGAMFRWYAGIERRAPAWMLRLGLWWLHRLLNHPIRHFRRYVIGNPLFLWRCLMQRFGR